jgi:hypothetical protein
MGKKRRWGKDKRKSISRDFFGTFVVPNTGLRLKPRKAWPRAGMIG